MLNSIKINPEITKKLSESTPSELIEQKEIGGTKLNYVRGSYVIDKLNSIFGVTGWDWEIKQFFIQDGVPFFQKKDKYNLAHIPEDKCIINWKNIHGVEVEQGPIAHVLGTLTVKMKDGNGEIVTLSKDAFGSKSVIGKQNEQESIFKSASTDALKKAASLLGIGLDLYRDEMHQDYFEYIIDSNIEDNNTEQSKEAKPLPNSNDLLSKLKKN